MGKAFIQESTLTDIADAIRSKNGSNDTYLPSEMADAINDIPVAIEEKDVNFYDWEGTVLYSYTKSEFAELASLPTPPDRTSENLTQEGWNLTKQDITDRINLGWDYVAVGCTYHTTDGKTYMTVEPDEFHPTVYLSLKADVANDVTVNWGDGNSVTLDSTSATALEHTYNSGLFGTTITLTIECATNGYGFSNVVEGSNYGKSKITSINLSGKEKYGSSTSDTSYRGFRSLQWLKNISLSNPSSVVYTYGLCSDCIALEHINVPNNIIVGPRAFMNCNIINRISVPKANSRYALFRGNVNLNKSDTIIINNVNSLAYTNYANYNTESIIIYEGPTLSDSYCFDSCVNLKKLILPSTLSTINSGTIIQYCYKLEEIYLKATTPPTLSAALTAPNTFYKIYVPRASCAAYKAASNWADIVDHIYPYDYDAIPDSLYFYMPNGGDVTLTKTGSPTEVTLEYSTDCGTTWTTWVENNNVRTLTLAAGQTMFVRNTSETQTGFSIAPGNYYNFSFNNPVYANGDIRSLMCKIPALAVISVYCLYNIMSNNPELLSIPKIANTDILGYGMAYSFWNCNGLTKVIIFKNTNFTLNSCIHMFNGCTSLTEAEIYVENNLTPSSLANLFINCTSLNKVILHAENSFTSTNWLKDVSATGDFYCPSTLTIPTDSASGIPTGWTRHDID